MADGEPNIVLIHSDQHRYDCIGANGHPLIETPSLDRLAREGINFRQAYCPIPLCVPARNSLFHGQWSVAHLCVANWDTEAPRPPPETLPTFSALLRDRGWNLGYVGKWHVHPEKNAQDPLYGFHEYVPEGQYTTWRQTRGLIPRPRRNRWFGESDPGISPQQSRLAWGADHAIRMIENWATAEAPFFVRWDPSEPHLPNVVPEPYASMYDPETIPPWPSYPDELSGKPYVQRQQRRTWQIEQWQWRDWAPVVARYLGDITLLDVQIGRILAALDRLGIAENTLVIYTSDHGDMCGGHGMIDKHFIMYDDVVRVPLIMRWPAAIPAGRNCEAFVTHSLDLAATFCDLAAVPRPETFQGESLLPLMGGAVDNGREDIFAMYHGNQFGLFSQRMVRDRRWKYVWNATALDEFYDVQNDPGELRNLARTPAYAGELQRLRRRLVIWMEAANDRLLNPWTRKQILEGLTE